jgi:MFS family permease
MMGRRRRGEAAMAVQAEVAVGVEPARRDERRNVLALGADYALFLVGLSFASQSTILPAFAEHLGAPSVVIGAIPAVMSLGWWLPSLFAAGHTASLPAKLPFVLRYTLWERVPFLALAALAFVTAERWPAATLAVVLGLLLVITGTGGVLMPAWMDVVGRAVPVAIRGRFFGISSVIANLGGFLGSLGTAWVLAALAPPRSYGVCFLVAAAFMALSWIALALVREPAGGPPAPVRPLREHLRRIPGLIARDPNLAWFLVARALSVAAMMGTGFYTVFALRVHGAAEWQVGLFTAALLGGQVAGNAAFGWLADRAGHRVVLLAGLAGTCAGSVVALTAPSVEVFTAVFALAGLQYAAGNVSALNVLLEFAPSADERPTYIGLGTTALAPVALLSPLAAGLAVDWLGFAPVFAAALACGLGGIAVLAGRVRDPRFSRAHGG